MTQAFQDMIYLFSCGARGIDPKMPHEMDVLKIYEQAQVQNVWTIVFLVIKQMYLQGQILIDKELYEKWNNQFLFHTMKYIQRKAFVHEVIETLENNKIQCCILKGEVLANLYHTPVCRMSSDTDILVDNKLKEEVYRILEKMDFTIGNRGDITHHVRCVHPNAGIIEIHHSLYDEFCVDVWFDNKVLNTEKYIKVAVDENKVVSTLGITDGMIFTALHYIKHFLNRGVGIRQLMDVLLYIQHYKTEIDWERFHTLMKYLRYDKFLNNSIGIGIQYLGFEQDDFFECSYDNGSMVKILSDIESGGVFGKSEDRIGFDQIYTRLRYDTFKSGDVDKYMKKLYNISFIKKLFPNPGNMKIKFPYVKKHPFLLPIAYIDRIVGYIYDKLSNKKLDEKHIDLGIQNIDNETIKKRMDLIRQLGMI